MPIYEYRCEDCKTPFEKLVRRAAEADDVACPSCGQKHVTRQLSTFAAHAGGTKDSKGPAMCPGGGVCPTPGACGMS